VCKACSHTCVRMCAKHVHTESGPALWFHGILAPFSGCAGHPSSKPQTENCVAFLQLQAQQEKRCLEPSSGWILPAGYMLYLLTRSLRVPRTFSAFHSLNESPWSTTPASPGLDTDMDHGGSRSAQEPTVWSRDHSLLVSPRLRPHRN
jgi:hypothetical protein